MKEKQIILVIFAACISPVFLYFWQFNGAFSDKIEDWSGFGSYIGGVATPILTIINIWVFIRLTAAINKDDERRKEEELRYQKRLILIQLRQNELNNFSTVVNKIFILKREELNTNILEPITSCLIYLEGLLSSKSHILPIINEDPFQKKLIHFRSLVTDYNDCISKSFDPSTLSDGNFDNVVIKKLLVALMQSRSELISELQSFILNNAEK